MITAEEKAYSVEHFDVYSENSDECDISFSNVKLLISKIHEETTIKIIEECEKEDKCIKTFIINDEKIRGSVSLGCRSIITDGCTIYNIKFLNKSDMERFIFGFKVATNEKNLKQSKFSKRVTAESATQYFYFYAQLFQQQNMIMDHVRTKTYQDAIIKNYDNFRNKVVLDVGTGSGILAFFAAQAGAKKVYAVEASEMADCASKLVANSIYKDVIEVIRGKVEEIKLPELVDIIISEPMGYLLFNERMIESFLYSKKFLKSEGQMFPTVANLYCAPLTNMYMYDHCVRKCNIWNYQDYYGVNLRPLAQEALEEAFSQPVIGYVESSRLQANPHHTPYDFSKIVEEDLHEINFEFKFTCNVPGITHGITFWFDVGFLGLNQEVWLSTAPGQPCTHWHHVTCLFMNPLFFGYNDVMNGSVKMVSNNKQSYYITVTAYVESRPFIVSVSKIDLKHPYAMYNTESGFN